MDLTGFQEDSAKVANALLREEHFAVSLDHGSSRSRTVLEVRSVSSQRFSNSCAITARVREVSGESLGRQASFTRQGKLGRVDFSIVPQRFTVDCRDIYHVI
jgi:hypothetical protein